MKPAMTKEEWADGPNELGYFDWEMGIVDTSGHFLTPMDFRHKLAAFTLHNQPFGFTREDVALVRDAVVELCTRDTGVRFADDRDYREIVVDYDEVAAHPGTSLADRIEALLPPEEST